MDAIVDPHDESENTQEEQVVETKVKTTDGRGRSPASLANLKPRAKKSPDEPKVKYAVRKPPQETMIYDMAEEAPKPKAPPKKATEPPKKKRRTKVVVVEQDSDDDSDDEQDIQVVVAKKPKKKVAPPPAPAPKRPPTPKAVQEESDDELEVKPPKPIIKAPPKPMINFF